MSVGPDLEMQPVDNKAVGSDSLLHQLDLNTVVGDNSQPEPVEHPTPGQEAGGSAPAGEYSMPRSKTFGMKKTAGNPPPYDPVAATYDYTVKYMDDPLFHELDDHARVWHVYNDEMRELDADMIEEASDSLDILLVFAGLFSAVLTTFLVQTSQALSPDHAAITVSLLKELVDLQRAQANGMSLNSVASASTTSLPSTIDKWVNGLWFASLALSLSDALMAVLAKQWLRQYHSRLSGSPKQRAILRYFRYTGFERWNVRTIMGFLPFILHVSLILFLVGLTLLLIPLNVVIAAVTGSITFTLLGTYLYTNFLPILQVQCPYRTPLTNLLYRLSRAIWLRLPTSRFPATLFRYSSANTREFRRASHLSETLIPKMLRTLWFSTTNSSAKLVASNSIIGFSLGGVYPQSESSAQEGKHQREIAPYRPKYSSIGLLFFSCWDYNGRNMLSSTAPKNLSDLTEDEKINLQRALLAAIALGPEEAFTSYSIPFQPGITLPWSCCVHVADLSLALVAIAALRDDFLSLSIMADEHFPVQSTHLKSKEALQWVIRHHTVLETPDLPGIVWQHLWEAGEYHMVKPEREAVFQEAKQLLLRAHEHLDQAHKDDFLRESQHWIERRPVSLVQFLAVKTYRPIDI